MPRFIPELCPGCQTRIEPRYSQYRHASQHILYVPLLIAGVVFVIALSGYLFRQAALDTIELLEGWGLRRKERGIIFFLALAATVPFIVWVCRIWWRFLDRLPRPFAHECPACHWTGTVKVKDLCASKEPSGSLQVVIDGAAPPPDSLVARSERHQHRLDLERRRKREQEQEQPPNPDFDFTGR